VARYLLILILIASVCLAQTIDPKAGLSLDRVNALVKTVQIDARTRAAINAVTNNDIKSLALNREIVGSSDDLFSFKLETKGITDQESSGRCWMFAGSNLLRQDAAKKLSLDEFEFSESYLAFYDLLEKSNVFLEYIIATRDKDIQDRELVATLSDPIGDGGYWGYIANLVEKYGVVPKKVMAESNSSAKTGAMQSVLATLLRRDASILRSDANKRKSVADLRKLKDQMLEDVTRVLVINYGVPPTSFEWRTKDTTGVVSAPVTYTPQEFCHDVLNADLSHYVSIANYPIHPFGKNYSISTMRSMADKPDVTLINIDGATMKDLAMKALLDSNRVWFGCDMGHDVMSKKGLMIKGLYDYEELFGVDLSMTKSERLDYRDQSSNHAMVLVGVDIVDGKPRKWLVENSWGKDRGDGGLFTMSDEWFDEFVLNVIIPAAYLPAEILEISKQKPTPLPIWDPVWQSVGVR
jgi:bleomycin hydrolase